MPGRLDQPRPAAGRQQNLLLAQVPMAGEWPHPDQRIARSPALAAPPSCAATAAAATQRRRPPLAYSAARPSNWQRRDPACAVDSVRRRAGSPLVRAVCERRGPPRPPHSRPPSPRLAGAGGSAAAATALSLGEAPAPCATSPTQQAQCCGSTAQSRALGRSTCLLRAGAPALASTRATHATHAPECLRRGSGLLSRHLGALFGSTAAMAAIQPGALGAGRRLPLHARQQQPLAQRCEQFAPPAPQARRLQRPQIDSECSRPPVMQQRIDACGRPSQPLAASCPESRGAKRSLLHREKCGAPHSFHRRGPPSRVDPQHAP